MCFLILQSNKLNREYTGNLPLHLVLMGFHLSRARSCVLEEARRGTDETAGINLCRIFLSLLLIAGLGYNFSSMPLVLSMEICRPGQSLGSPALHLGSLRLDFFCQSLLVPGVFCLLSQFSALYLRPVVASSS